MKVSLRDDDISYFTEPEEIERAWRNVDLPVTFAVVPFVADLVERYVPGREFVHFEAGPTEHPLRENSAIVSFLREWIAAKRASASLHGCTHRYQICGRSVVAEYVSGDEVTLTWSTQRALREVETLLDTRVEVFVPPDNAISREGMSAVAAAGLRYVQRALPWRYSDAVDAQLLPSWIPHASKRLYYRARYGIVYSQPFFNGTVIEWPAYLFKKRISLERAKRDFDLFYSLDLPFTIATHYWELADQSLRSNLLRLLDHIHGKPGVTFGFLGDAVS